MHNQLKQFMSWLDYNHLIQLAHKMTPFLTEQVKFVQQRKLERFGVMSADGIAHKVIFNLSDRILSDRKICPHQRFGVCYLQQET